MIELLIVVAIILIIAAIAIPNLLRSKIAANQASCVGSLRTINTAEVTYSSTYNTGYTATLSDLGPPASATAPTATSAGLIDEVLAAGTKSGYSLAYVAGAPDGAGHIDTYTVTGSPVSAGSTGQNSYFTDESNVIRFATSGTATASNSPIGG